MATDILITNLAPKNYEKADFNLLRNQGLNEGFAELLNNYKE